MCVCVCVFMSSSFMFFKISPVVDISINWLVIFIYVLEREEEEICGSKRRKYRQVESYIKSEEYGIFDGPVGLDIRRMAGGEKYCRVSLTCLL